MRTGRTGKERAFFHKKTCEIFWQAISDNPHFRPYFVAKSKTKLFSTTRKFARIPLVDWQGIMAKPANNWFLPTFGDSLKRNTICSACTPRRGSQALPARESLSHVHNVAPDSAAMARHPTSHGGRPLKAARHHAPSRLWQPAWLYGLGVGLGRRTQAGGLGRPIAWGPHEAAAEEIKARAAEHLALQHFETVDVALDRPIGPGQCHARFDRLIVVVEPRGKALQGLLHTGGRALQPRIDGRRLSLTDQRGKVLREVDRLRHFALLGAQQGELLGLSCRALRLAPEHQPGGPARRERWGGGLGHDGERLAPALPSGWQALGLADTADIRGDAAIAPRIAPRLELPKELHRGPAARIPALKQVVLRGIAETPPIVAAVLPPGPRRRAHIPLDGAPAAADLRRDRGDRPALVVQGPYFIIERLPAGGALGRPCLLGRGCGRRWYRDRVRPIRQWDGLLAHRGVDGVEHLAMRGEHLGQGFRQVLQEMKTVRDLGGGGGPLARTLSIRLRAVTRDDLHPWMLPEPLRHGVRGAIREEGHGLTALQIDQHRAIDLIII